MSPMDFEKALAALLDGFEARKIRCAAIGGFALGLLGAPRATLDLDFLVNKEDLSALDALMASLGYARRYRSENVSQFAAVDDSLGCVDFLHAFRPVSRAMLGRAAPAPAPGGRRVLVLEAEDVIGLKVQAMANDPRRASKETADIESLAQARGGKLDWGRLEEFYGLFHMDDRLRALKERFPDA
ncbi:MAG: nucleotidyltransferase family protein [Elusimicrobia bacterium]|nr:nucleotidyltransferase family protein [Elusimicrobiota bacterium]